eukprot:CAMPEP_0172453274 /NCGR_PEP_ID=MMETSP1065-20121228/10670_1 /TAXON_ID=265537 /ORGANISM="Amphiprora paludosa, Strain CCMP125" /LENGTH=655 /DNA_ID=CAMNT_0013205453 /DNA_START=97 /DNA_END=2064 /DNA_ORIENTATION=+
MASEAATATDPVTPEVVTEDESKADKTEPKAEEEPSISAEPVLTDAIPTVVTAESGVGNAESYDVGLNKVESTEPVEAEDKETTTPTTQQPLSSQRGLKVLFLSSDTGGGHRASAESLAKQFQILFPGSTYDLLDVVEEDFGPPYNSLVSLYKHLSAHPSQWKLLYTISNSRGVEMIMDAHFKLMFERAIRKRIKTYSPDVVVSVHPMMTNVPVVCCKKISNETGRHLPMFTVVTDLGSAHCLWFANGVEKMFVGSEQVKELAKARGKVPDEKIVLSGLPIRHDFAVQAENMGDRMSKSGQEYQVKVRAELQLPFTHRKTVLIMGGGEGVGSLSNIVDAIYVELTAQGIDALVLVVCGRNEKLKKQLEERDWAQVFNRWQHAKLDYGVSKGIMSFGDTCGTGITTASAGCIQEGTVTGSIRRMLSTGSLTVGNMMSAPPPTSPTRNEANIVASEEKKADDAGSSHVTQTPEKSTKDDAIMADTVPTSPTDESGLEETNTSNNATPGNVHVMGLGFVTKMAEYMVAADVLVTKAGPGTISEAAALSLPVMLTSFLPGQEEGNVDYVIEGGFGAFVNDTDPIGIAEELCMWLTNDEKRTQLSVAAKAKGAPYAARDIIKQIGDSTLKWREINDEKDQNEAEETATKAAAEQAASTCV